MRYVFTILVIELMTGVAFITTFIWMWVIGPFNIYTCTVGIVGSMFIYFSINTLRVRFNGEKKSSVNELANKIDQLVKEMGEACYSYRDAITKCPITNCKGYTWRIELADFKQDGDVWKISLWHFDTEGFECYIGPSLEDALEKFCWHLESWRINVKA